MMMTKPWAQHKSVIVKLYISEGRTLADVRVIMKQRYGFEASIRSFRQHFDSWGIGKYNCKKRDDRRQKKARARQSLPSPPPDTPITGAASIDLPSPDSLTRSSSISSGQSILSDASPRMIQPRPLYRPYYDGHAFEHAGARFKSSHIWGGEMEVPTTGLRNPNMSDGILPLPIESPSMSQSRGLTKYVAAGYPDPDWPRSPYELSHTEPGCYGSAYKESVPRCMPDSFPPSFHRSGGYQQPLRDPRSMPRLPMVQQASPRQGAAD